MVRMLKPGEIQEAEYSFDPAAEAKRDEADFQARWGTEGASAADNKKTNNKGGVLPLHTHQKDRHRLHLKWSRWGCKSPFDKWGFDETFPLFLDTKLSQEQWDDAVKQLNRGYLASMLPKLVWLPLFGLTIFGAVLEAILSTWRTVPTGIIIGTCAGLGAYGTVCLWMYMRYLVGLETERLRVVCSHLSETYGTVKVTFDVDADDTQISVIVLSHEGGVDVQLKILDPISSDADTHVMRVVHHPERTQVGITERTRPLIELAPGEVFMVGKGPRRVLERKLNEATCRSVAAAPLRGWCDCTKGTRGYASGLGWSGHTDKFIGESSRGGSTYDPHTGRDTEHGILLWNNKSLQLCPICDKAVRPEKESSDPVKPDPRFDPLMVPPTAYEKVSQGLRSAVPAALGKLKSNVSKELADVGGREEREK